MVRFLVVVVLTAATVAAADSAFELRTTSPQPYTTAYVGNGLMGLSTSVPGTLPAACYLAGIYDRAAGDVPRLAVLPSWNEIDVSAGSAWLNRSAAGGHALRDYSQVLDLFHGAVRTEYRWSDRGRAFRIRVESFVSRDDPQLGVVRLDLTPEFSGAARVRFAVRAWPPPRRYRLAELSKLPPEAARSQAAIWYPGHMTVTDWDAGTQPGGANASAFARAEGSQAAVSEALAIRWPRDLPLAQAAVMREAGARAVEIRFQAHAGTPHTFSVFAAVLPSFHGEKQTTAAGEEARRAAERGYDAVYSAHAAAWANLWQSDILVEGDPELQRVIHSMLFYLLGSARADSAFSIPPMGLSSAGYYGHVFWDADTFMLPPLLLLHPRIARTLIGFRSRTLAAARANAARNHYRGAMYPWEAGPEGEETTPRFAGQNALYENHVNADIALAAWQYYLATGDRSWLERDGFPIIRDTADFWLSRVTYNHAQDRYEIGKVVSVNESLIGVDNDAYTNAAAKRNLELAARSAALLKQPANARWEEVARKMYLPSTELVMAGFPLEFPLREAERRTMAQKSLSRTPEGAMMGSEFQPIVAAQLGDRKLLDALLPRTWRPFVRAPFYVPAETPNNQNTNFLTGAGAFLQQFLFGYSGLRLGTKGLEPKYRPVLPTSIRKLTLRGVSVHGQQRTFTVANGSIQ